MKYVALALATLCLALVILRLGSGSVSRAASPVQDFRILPRLLEVGDTLQLLAIRPETSPPRLNGLEAEITWRSANLHVATVDANGLVTGVAVGRTTIFATCHDCPAELREAEFPIQIGRYARLVPVVPHR